MKQIQHNNLKQIELPENGQTNMLNDYLFLVKFKKIDKTNLFSKMIPIDFVFVFIMLQYKQ